MNGRYQTFSGPMSRQQRLANMLEMQGRDNVTPPQDGQYNPMVTTQARPQFGRAVPRGMVKPRSPGLTTPQGGGYRGDFDYGQE